MLLVVMMVEVFLAQQILVMVEVLIVVLEALVSLLSDTQTLTLQPHPLQALPLSQ
jgi:hypothetical protein